MKEYSPEDSSYSICAISFLLFSFVYIKNAKLRVGPSKQAKKNGPYYLAGKQLAGKNGGHKTSSD